MMSPAAVTDYDAVLRLGEEEQRCLLRVAVQSVVHGLRCGERFAVDLDTVPARLRREQACFVTLHNSGELRGCVGILEPHRPLAQQVADSGYDAAFRDTRLSPVQEWELDQLTLDVSVLSPLVDLRVASERDLFRELRPGVDGVVVTEGEHQATFLPKVWETFELPFDFVEHLKRKAGLPPRYWSPALQWRRYTVESFGAAVAELIDG